MLVDPKSGKLHEIISGSTSKDPNSFLGDGSFLMYPWNSRLEGPSPQVENKKFLIEPVFEDRKMPIHGLYAMTEREVDEIG